jgi:hypothetical protein
MLKITNPSCNFIIIIDQKIIKAIGDRDQAIDLKPASEVVLIVNHFKADL